jgi:hypothetical protein
VKRKLAIVFAALWLIGAVTGVSTAVFARGVFATNRLLCGVWLGIASILALRDRAAGWWCMLVYLLFFLGVHTNRALSVARLSPFERAEPLLWIALHLSLIIWLRKELGYHPGHTSASEARV